jgi:hypothetical protein
MGPRSDGLGGDLGSEPMGYRSRNMISASTAAATGRYGRGSAVHVVIAPLREGGQVLATLDI